jgi:hypothetical protein
MTELMPMPEIDRAGDGDPVDEAELAAAVFLARYQGRTLDAYRYDLQAFFQWAADDRLDILQATRPQIELYVRAMEARGLAATTIDRRLSTVCGFYRFAHIDGRIASNPAQYVRWPKVRALAGDQPGDGEADEGCAVDRRARGRRCRNQPAMMRAVAASRAVNHQRRLSASTGFSRASTPIANG